AATSTETTPSCATTTPPPATTTWWPTLTPVSPWTSWRRPPRRTTAGSAVGEAAERGRGADGVRGRMGAAVGVLAAERGLRPVPRRQDRLHRLQRCARGHGALRARR